MNARDLVNEYFDAEERGDVEAVVALCADDVAAAVAGAGMAPPLWSAMRRLIPVVVRIGSIPVIVPAGRLPQGLRPASPQPLSREKTR